MGFAICNILNHLQDFKIPEIKALVHSDNAKTIKILETIGFKLIHQETSGNFRHLYSLRLN
jgi:RimJ/RimL family protein N-acetyltransferase